MIEHIPLTVDDLKILKKGDRIWSKPNAREVVVDGKVVEGQPGEFGVRIVPCPFRYMKFNKADLENGNVKLVKEK